MEVLSHKPGPPLQLANLVNRVLPRPSIFGKGHPPVLFLGPPTSLLRRGCPVLQVPYAVAHRGPTLAGAVRGGSERLSSPRSQNGPWRSSASSALLPHSHSTDGETEAQNGRAAPGLTVSEADSLRAVLCPLRAWLVQAGPSLISLHHPPASPLRASPLPLRGPNSQSGHTTGGPGSRQAARPRKGEAQIFSLCRREQGSDPGSQWPFPRPHARSHITEGREPRSTPHLACPRALITKFFFCTNLLWCLECRSLLLRVKASYFLAKSPFPRRSSSNSDSRVHGPCSLHRALPPPSTRSSSGRQKLLLPF